MTRRADWVHFFGSRLRDYVPLGRLSYAQEGEDLVLARIMSSLPAGKDVSGFYVDIGAHHPVRFSNTYYFYRRGWRGINVDPMPGTATLFRRMRPKDITVECGIGAQAKSMTYYVFNESALNTFSEIEAQKKNQSSYRILRTTQIPVVTLEQMLDEHLPTGMSIDFMSIDTEGLDQEVVSSNDWSRYRPRVLLIEILNTGIEESIHHPTAQLLRQHGYRVLAKTFNTFFFIAS